MYCTGCGKELKSGADFCVKCGKAIEKISVPVVSNAPKKANFNQVVSIIFMSLSGLFFLLSFGFMGVASDYEYVYDSYSSSGQFSGYMILAAMFFISAVILGVSSALMNKKTCSCGTSCDCGC